MEFLLAQAPYAMKGLLIGSFYSTWALGNLATMALMLLFPQYRKTSEKSQLSCGSLYYLLCTVAAIIGLVAFTVMLLKYSNRKRDEVITVEKDYSLPMSPLTLVFPDSSVTEITFTLTILDDGVYERDEEFELVLNASGDAAVSFNEKRTTRIVILDNDG